MKAPIKPVRPSKPFPPNKDQKINKHSLDIDHLFYKYHYYDDDGIEITKEQWKASVHSFEREEESCTPSLKDLLNLIPSNINLDNIYLDLQTGSECPGINPITTFDGISIFYTTPFSYDEEFVKYNEKMKQYNRDIEKYNDSLEKYKEDKLAYKKYKEKYS